MNNVYIEGNALNYHEYERAQVCEVGWDGEAQRQGGNDV